MKKITAHFNTGSGLVAQTFEVYQEFDLLRALQQETEYIEVDLIHGGWAMIRIADVAFWTYDT